MNDAIESSSHFVIGISPNPRNGTSVQSIPYCFGFPGRQPRGPQFHFASSLGTLTSRDHRLTIRRKGQVADGSKVLASIQEEQLLPSGNVPELYFPGAAARGQSPAVR